MKTFTYNVRIYYKDTDASGIVYHANYLALAEQARTYWQLEIDDNYANQAMIARHEGFVVREAVLEYFRPAKLDDEITIKCNTAELGGAYGAFYQEFLRGEEKLASLKIKVVLLNTENGRPLRIPAELKAKYAEYLLPADTDTQDKGE